MCRPLYFGTATHSGHPPSLEHHHSHLHLHPPHRDPSYSYVPFICVAPPSPLSVVCLANGRCCMCSFTTTTTTTTPILGPSTVLKSPYCVVCPLLPFSILKPSTLLLALPNIPKPLILRISLITHTASRAYYDTTKVGEHCTTAIIGTWAPSSSGNLLPTQRPTTVGHSNNPRQHDSIRSCLANFSPTTEL